MKSLSNSELIEGIRSGDKRLLGKAITLVAVSYTHLDVYKRQVHNKKFYQKRHKRTYLSVKQANHGSKIFVTLVVFFYFPNFASFYAFK